MLKIRRIIILLVVLYFGVVEKGKAQTGNIISSRGHYVRVYFDDFNDYNSGYTLSQYTRFKVEFQDLGFPTRTWKIYARAKDGVTDLNGDLGGTISVAVIELTAEDGGNVPGTPTFYSNVSLSDTWQLLVENADQGSGLLVDISYQIGPNNALRVTPSETYSVDIEFILSY